MENSEKKVLICNCEKTMQLDAKAIGKACGAEAPFMHHNLCRTQLDRYDQALSEGQPFVVTCTQERPLFSEIAAEKGQEDLVNFINIREQAGWCETTEDPTAKIAALIKASTYQSTPTRLKSITSDGLCLVYGRGQQALVAAQILSAQLSVTLLLDDADDIVLPTVLNIPVFEGRIKTISGSFGGFDVIVDDYAAMIPSSRNKPEYTLARNGVASQCSVILDISGRDPLIAGHRHRDGYRRVDPKDAAGVFQAVNELSEMIGEFEKPIYVDYNADICAHSRSGKTGCNKCQDVCPAGAISDIGDYIAVDAGICGGCGSCHAVCPTGAISYTYPKQVDLVGRAQMILGAYRDAGGLDPIILVHDHPFGSDLIGAIARYGKGLPANVIPLPLHAVTSFGHVEMVSCLAAGATKIQILAAPEMHYELTGLQSEIELTHAIMSGFGFGDDNRIDLIVEADPELCEGRLWDRTAEATGLAEVFSAVGTKHEVARTVFGKLHAKSKIPDEILPLALGAPYGGMEIDQSACTLCMACVSICPADAMRDTADKPQLRFIESACVQCGLCATACPETALNLVPRLNVSASALQPVTLYEEEPFHCIECGKAFATKSTITRISEQLAGKHSMFQGEGHSRLIEMCADCKVVSQANSENNPFTVGTRPRVRTTDDYLKAEAKGLSVDDFLIDD